MKGINPSILTGLLMGVNIVDAFIVMIECGYSHTLGRFSFRWNLFCIFMLRVPKDGE